MSARRSGYKFLPLILEMPKKFVAVPVQKASTYCSASSSSTLSFFSYPPTLSLTLLLSKPNANAARSLFEIEMMWK